MLDSVLIANRGEIACRIIRTAKRMGMRTIAVYSEADADALFVRMADEAHLIGPAPARESYLAIDKIIEVAKRTGAACIHPGYGFLSERAEFADACAANHIVFVGPPADSIRAMGLKDAAKALVQKANVPVVPGYHGNRQEPDFLRERANEIGYPVLIKAVAGGGGKGMRLVEKADDFVAALESAQREAQSSFGDPRVLVEKYILSPRHIEIQVFADRHGNVVHLFERDCSLQRRHQKVIEEAPAPGINPEMREAMGRAAVEAARAVGYVGAGTVEFIVDGREGLRADRFYFMEMNTRLQVEHPVTEAITGLDLVELQFRAAAGEKLPFSQADLSINGHAVEARIYAEDPEKEFLPSTGKLWALDFPEGEGIRVDTGVEQGDEVTPYYDPMIAKLIVHAPTREEALDRLAQALGDSVVAGPKNNVAFLKKLCEAEAFTAGQFDTGFIDRNLEELGAYEQSIDIPAAKAAAALIVWQQEHTLRNNGFGGHSAGWLNDSWDEYDGFEIMQARRSRIPMLVNGERVEFELTYPGGDARLELHGTPQPEHVQILLPKRRQEHRDATNGAKVYPLGNRSEMIALKDGRQTRVALFDPFDVDIEHLDAGSAIKAPMHGKLIAVFVKPGDAVEKGQRLAIVEAMKMEHALVAPASGEVEEILEEVGAQVSEGARLISLKSEE